MWIFAWQVPYDLVAFLVSPHDPLGKGGFFLVFQGGALRDQNNHPHLGPKKRSTNSRIMVHKMPSDLLDSWAFCKKMSSDAKSVVFMALFLAKYNIYHLINLEFLRKFLVPDENLCSRHFNEIVEELNYCVCVSEGWPSRN